METKAAVGHQDFDPSYELVQEEGIDTLVFKLPEFKKEQIRVQFDKFENLSISGERPLADNRWSRFRKNFRIEGCNEIRHRFENGRLYVSTLPKFLIKEDEKKGKEKVLVNIIAAVVVLVVMALYMTSKT